jgi:hypothetical protein
MTAFNVEGSVIFKTGFMPIVGVVVLALICGCVSNVKTESAATFGLTSGQTWDWFPEKVKPWSEYEREAAQARIDAHEAEAAERREDSGKEVHDAESEPSTPSPFAAGEARSLEREHKHIQESIQDEMSSRGIRRIEGELPTYYVAYYLLVGEEPVAARDYASYQDRTESGSDGEDYDEDTLLIDLVDPATGQLLWSGSGVGNTRWGADTGADEPARMRSVKEAVRHIMRDLK